MSRLLDLGKREFIDPPDPPGAAVLERMRTAFRSLPRVSEVWVHGERYTKKGLPPHEMTVISLVLDPGLRGQDLWETEGLLDAVGDYNPTRNANHAVGFTKIKDFHKKNGTRDRAGDVVELIYAREFETTVDRGREFKRKAWARRLVGAAFIAAVLISVMVLPVENLGWERFLLLMIPVWCLAALLAVWDGSRD